MILIVKHIDIEGPGTWGDFLDIHNVPYRILDLGAGDKLPEDLSKLKAVVVLGGPMNVDEENKYPWLVKENEFIKEILRRQIPFLGICLGSQLLAKAAGAQVVRSPVKEIGWYHVQLTDEGKNDPLLKDFREDNPIYQWHEDMFHVPQGGKLLASADGCPHQAFKVGVNAYGLQFHVEVTDKSIKEWCEEYAQNDLNVRKEHAASMLKDYAQYKQVFDQQANTLYQNFLTLCHLPSTLNV